MIASRFARTVLISALLTPQVAIVSAVAASKPHNDDYITDSIRDKLATDTTVKGGDLDVVVKDGVVTISGKVKEQRQKDKAEHIAKKVGGVKSVINNIKVDKP